jgi:hypothetical protein
MATLVGDPTKYLKRLLTRRTRVLLINPPVEERRYHWLRWNQPLELLRLSSWIREHEKNAEVRLFDFMLPVDDAGTVPKHKVKESWTGAPDDEQLWHFGQPFEVFETSFRTLLFREGWVPDVIVVSSLTSYWHTSIEKLLNKICMHLGKPLRRRAKICLYGNYPRIEPNHAERQPDADVAFTRTVEAAGRLPDFSLYLKQYSRLPAFFGLDIEDKDLFGQLEELLDLLAHTLRQRGNTRPAVLNAAFFNSDVCSEASSLDQVVRFVEENPKQLHVEGICGIEPSSLSHARLTQLRAAGFQTLFVEHARKPGGGIDEPKYQSLLEFMRTQDAAKRDGSATSSWLQRGNVTGFVAMGLPDDDLDELVRSTLVLNSYFQAVILKPFGYSPTLDDADEDERMRRWRAPYAMSPQRFPYVGHGSRLTADDYENLVRWQSVLNKRVKGDTFDFLGAGNVARLARETLIAESWKRQRGVL